MEKANRLHELTVQNVVNLSPLRTLHAIHEFKRKGGVSLSFLRIKVSKYICVVSKHDMALSCPRIL